MPRKQHSHHYIYRITCIITDRYYIGMHSTSNIEDGYMGSGQRIRRSIKKHGIENHVKEILEFLPDRKTLAEKEKEIVNLELLKDRLCMNLKQGGFGGRVYSDKSFNNFIKAGNIAFKEKLKNDPMFKANFSRKRSDANKKAGIKRGFANPECWTWAGKKHTPETIEKMKNTRKGQGTGSSNSQFGTCWITKDKINKKIPKERLDEYLSSGWNKGRFIK